MRTASRIDGWRRIDGESVYVAQLFLVSQICHSWRIGETFIQSLIRLHQRRYITKLFGLHILLIYIYSEVYLNLLWGASYKKLIRK